MGSARFALLLFAGVGAAGCLGGSPVGTCRSTDDNEPNDDPATAVVLELESLARGCIQGASADVDRFLLQAPPIPESGGYWDVQLQGPMEGGTRLSVRNTAVDGALDLSLSPEDSPTQLYLGADAGGSVELTLTADGGGAVDLGYDLLSSWIPIDDRWEPNESQEEAPDITLGQSVTAFCNGSFGEGLTAPRDWYRLIGATDGAAVVSITSAPADIVLQVLIRDEPSGRSRPVGQAVAAGQTFSATIPVTGGVRAFAVGPRQEQAEAVFGDDELPPPAFGTPYTFTVTQ